MVQKGTELPSKTAKVGQLISGTMFFKMKDFRLIRWDRITHGTIQLQHYTRMHQ